MMYPVLFHGDGREKRMNRGFQSEQLFQWYPDRAKNSLNAAAKNLVDPYVVKPRCFELNCVSSLGHTSRTKDF